MSTEAEIQRLVVLKYSLLAVWAGIAVLVGFAIGLVALQFLLIASGAVWLIALCQHTQETEQRDRQRKDS